MDVSISIAPFGSLLHKQAIELRREILRIPLGLDFTAQELQAENEQIHIVLKHNNKVIGIVLLQILDVKNIKMRQFAIDSLFQNQGFGSHLVQFAEQYCRENKFQNISLHARANAVQFYLNNGYQISGDEFMEVNIPHFKMLKHL